MANTKITSRVIADNAVTSSAIADGAITEAKLASGVGGVAGIVSSADATAITIDSSEQVGIGTSNPPHKFSVFGTGAGNATVQIEGEGGADPYINFLANNTQHWSVGIDDSDSDKFKISEHSGLGTNDYLVVDTSGNVGINTTDIDAILHVKDDAAANDNFDVLIEGFRPNLVFEDISSSATDFQLFVDSNRLDFLYGDASTDTKLANTAMSINNSGNVGIGTTTTFSNPLTLNKAAGAANSLNNQIALTHTGASTAYHIKTIRAAATDEPDGIAFVENTTERMRIRGGNVGIGTDSPLTELHVYSADQNALTVETNTGINQIHLSNSTNSPTYITQDSYSLIFKADENGWGGTASSMQFKVKAEERMRINSVGALVLQEGNPIYTDTLRNDSHNVTTSDTTILDFSTAGAVGAARGFYLVTIVRAGASVGTHGVYLVGLSASNAVILYETLRSASLIASTSGANFQVRKTGTTVACHATAVPIGLTGN